MCGRYALALSRREIRENLRRVDEELEEEWVDEEHFHPRYNIAPRSYAPVIRRRRSDESSGASSNDTSGEATNDDNDAPPDPEGEDELHADDSSTSSHLILHTMKWGVVPHWSKFEDKALNTTNARSENLVQGGGMWNSMRGKKRCVVVCQGYYEWQKKGRDKLPHFTKHKTEGKLMLLAGLYDRVLLKGSTQPLYTFAIVTTSAPKDFTWLHERQPVILSSKSALDTWLDTSSQTWTPELTKLVRPYCDRKAPLECYQVPKEVGKVGTESSTFIHPVKDRKDGIQAMFSKQKKEAGKPTKDETDDSAKKIKSATPAAATPAKQEQGDDPSSDVELIDDPQSSTSKKPATGSKNTTTGNKRKRTSSPASPKHPSKDEDGASSDIELLDGPPSPPKSNPKGDPSSKSTPSSPPKKRPKAEIEPPGTASPSKKITNFFKKQS